jgi:hypothetical protein
MLIIYQLGLITVAGKIATPEGPVVKLKLVLMSRNK